MTEEIAMSPTAAVVYVGPHDAVYVPMGQLEVTCHRGVPVEFPADLAASLCEQETWEPAKPAKTKTAQPVATPEEG